jgi:uncharacterized membrane protein
MYQHQPLTVCAALLLVAAASYGQQASFQGLGDLPGGDFYSQAFSVSADGNVVVGWSHGVDPGIPFQTSHEAFRWTAQEGMVGLGDLDTAFVFSSAYAVSGDGSVIVGEGSFGSGTGDRRPFRWTETAGMKELTDSTGELDLRRASDVSADGVVIVGHANPTTGGNVAYRWTESGGQRTSVRCRMT